MRARRLKADDPLRYWLIKHRRRRAPAVVVTAQGRLMTIAELREHVATEADLARWFGL
jgi:hypothetical protein